MVGLQQGGRSRNQLDVSGTWSVDVAIVVGGLCPAVDVLYKFLLLNIDAIVSLLSLLEVRARMRLILAFRGCLDCLRDRYGTKFMVVFSKTDLRETLFGLDASAY